MPKFQKVGPCLYRYSNGAYYARFQSRGKEVWRSLKTIDHKYARRLLKAEQDKFERIDAGSAKLSLSALCKDYLDSIRNLKASTRVPKERTIRRIKARWPGGASMRVSDITDEPDRFLAKFAFGASGRNAFVTVLRELFALAVRKKCIATSPVAHIQYKKRPHPIRLTPSFEEFQAIVADIRAQAFAPDAEASGDFVEFIGLCGVGQAEAANVRRQDVDLKAGILRLFRAKTSQRFDVPIYPLLRPLLERLCADLHPRDKVFAIKNAKKSIAGACKRLGLPHYTQRSFRRMFIRRAIELGVDVKTIASWQGHRDGGKLILDTYGSEISRPHSHRMAQLLTLAQPDNVIELSGAV
jgi:integrase